MANRGPVKRPRHTGTFLGIPYDWRWPTWPRVKEKFWNPDDRHVFTPHLFGWGWSINFHELLCRLHLIHRRPGG